MQFRDRIKELRRVHSSMLRPNPRNWRTHPQAQQDALRGVLAEVGIADAVLARECEDGGLMLLDGHLRVETLPDAEIPVLILDVTEAEGDKILATLDPLAAMAEADANKLDELLREVETGSQALADMLTDLADEAGVLDEEQKEVVEDEVPEVPVEPITKPGDLWILGDHRVLCGDSTKAEDVGRLMAGAKAGLCFTSPPYGQQRDYTKEGKEKCQDWDGLMRGVFANLPMSPAGQVLVNLGLIHRDGEWVPYWDEWINWMGEQGWRRFGWYVWDQGPGLPGDWNGRFAPSHEFVFHFNRQSVRPCKTKPCIHAGTKNHGSGLRGQDNEVSGYSHAGKDVQSEKIPDSVIRQMRHKARGIECEHPAVFAVPFASEFLEAWPGVAYEPFCGSGTTLIAAEQLGRKCYGMEISPQYCDVIVKRWENLTGHKAVLEQVASKKANRAKV